MLNAKKKRFCLLFCSTSFFNINISHQVTFSSLDVHLHTEALLNTMNFLTNLLPPSTKKEGGQEELPTIPEEDEAEGEKEGEKKEETTVAKKKSTVIPCCYLTFCNLIYIPHYQDQWISGA